MSKSVGIPYVALRVSYYKCIFDIKLFDAETGVVVGVGFGGTVSTIFDTGTAVSVLVGKMDDAADGICVVISMCWS